MNQQPWLQGKKCVLCGRFFEPDRRVGKRQKCCRDLKCQKKRKRIQERVWLSKTPDYFCGRYEYVRTWRQAHPRYQKTGRCKKAAEIQTQIPSPSPMKSMRLHLRCNWRWDEIQTQILRVTRAGESFWVERC